MTKGYENRNEEVIRAFVQSGDYEAVEASYNTGQENFAWEKFQFLDAIHRLDRIPTFTDERELATEFRVSSTVVRKTANLMVKVGWRPANYTATNIFRLKLEA